MSNASPSRSELIERVNTLERELAELKRTHGQPPAGDVTKDAMSVEQLREEITTRKGAEQELRRAHRKLSQLNQRYFEVSPLIVVALDRSGRVTMINPAGCRILGRPEQDIVGKNWFTHFLPQRISEQVLKIFKKIIAGDMDFVRTFENPIVTAQGDERLICWHNAFLSDEEDNITDVISTGNDITEQRRIEEERAQLERRFRDLVENTSDWIWEIDENDIFSYASPRIRDLLGYEPEEVIGRKSAFDLMPASEREKVSRAFRRIKKERRSFSSLENANLHKDGRLITIETSGVPIFDRDGIFRGYRGIDRDITERKRLEEELTQAFKMEAVGTLAGGIAHDFNNILAAIIGFTDLVITATADRDDIRPDLNNILHAANRAKELVKQILTFCRKEELRLAPLNPVPSTKEGIKLLRATLPSTVEIEEQIDPECGTILADPTQFHQVLVNLCTNAFQSLPKETGTITVALRRRHLSDTDANEQAIPSGDFIELEVHDTGQGMERLTMDRIFDPYFTTKKKGKGTGMGLAMVHGIVRSHGGFIEVASTPGSGSTFRACLPACKEQPAPSSTQPASAQIPRGKGNILYIDDEEIITVMAQKILSQLGYHVTTRTSSTEALELFQQDPAGFDLVITDQTMPELPGNELAERLIAIRPKIPIILCTGYSSLVNERSSQKIGIKEFLMKPFSMKDIAEVIERALAS